MISRLKKRIGEKPTWQNLWLRNLGKLHIGFRYCGRAAKKLWAMQKYKTYGLKNQSTKKEMHCWKKKKEDKALWFKKNIYNKKNSLIYLIMFIARTRTWIKTSSFEN